MDLQVIPYDRFMVAESCVERRALQDTREYSDLRCEVREQCILVFLVKTGTKLRAMTRESSRKETNDHVSPTKLVVARNAISVS
jgi:hypothetical protein